MEADRSRGQRFKNRLRFNKVNSTQAQVRCWHCGQTGHISRECKAEDIRRAPMGHGRSRLTFDQNNNPGNKETLHKEVDAKSN